MSIVNLQNEPIMCRSPFMVEVDEPNTIGSKVEFYIWNNGDTPPTSPTYELSKGIPSPTKTEMVYNVSNYLKEYIAWAGSTPTDTASPIPTPATEWCIVKIIRYKLTITGYTALDTKTYYAFDGFGYFEQGYNPELGVYGLTPGTYEYWYTPEHPGSSFPQPNIYKYGNIRVVPKLDYEVVWTSLATGVQNNFVFSSGIIAEVQQFFCVFPSNDQYGNKVEYKTDTGTLLATWVFKPKNECRYVPVVCDFVNQYGSWQRTIFYKKNKTSLKVTAKEYDLYAREVVNYDTRIGQRQVFNLEGKETIIVNTDWVEDSYNELVLKPLMLSEQILLNDKPVTMVTRATELFENINNKTINYQLNFAYAYDKINSII